MMRTLNRTNCVCHSGEGRNPRLPSVEAAFGTMDPGLLRGDVRRRGDTISRRVMGFTLVEILIVVIILGILAAIVIPQFANTTQEARDNMLRENLRNLRTQINVYRAQHRDVSPGYPDGDENQTPDADVFVDQMTLATDEYGVTLANGANASEAVYGPYLRSMPKNPVNRKAAVEMLDNSGGAIVGDDSDGWVFRPQDVVFVADTPDPYDTY